MTFLTLLAGTSLIIPVFAAFLWAGYQAFRQTGLLRLAHAASAILTVLGIAAVSYDIEFAGEFTGVFLGVAAAVAIWLEKGWSKAFPLILLFLAVILILHLPFPEHA